MALPMGPIQIEVGDIVESKGRCCVVQEVEICSIGVSKYTLQDLVTADLFTAFIHEIDKPQYVALVDSVLDNWSGEEPVSETETTQTGYFQTPQIPLWEIRAPTSTTTTRPSSTTTRPINRSPEPAPPFKRRHTCPTEQELDKIDAARLSKNTDQQTQWGVKIFKGKHCRKM